MIHLNPTIMLKTHHDLPSLFHQAPSKIVNRVAIMQVLQQISDLSQIPPS